MTNLSVGSTFLTPADVQHLTGRARKDLQADWLRRHGYRFEINGRGDVVIARAEVERILVGGKQNRGCAEPNFAALGR